MNKELEQPILERSSMSERSRAPQKVAGAKMASGGVLVLTVARISTRRLAPLCAELRIVLEQVAPIRPAWIKEVVKRNLLRMNIDAGVLAEIRGQRD